MPFAEQESVLEKLLATALPETVAIKSGSRWFTSGIRVRGKELPQSSDDSLDTAHLSSSTPAAGLDRGQEGVELAHGRAELPRVPEARRLVVRAYRYFREVPAEESCETLHCRQRQLAKFEEFQIALNKGYFNGHAESRKIWGLNRFNCC